MAVSVNTIRNLAIHEITPFRFSDRSVKNAWEHASRLWSIYGFTHPRVNRSILDSDIPPPHPSEIADMNFAEKRVTVNLHRMEQCGILDLLNTIFIHELGHKFCPGDLKTLLLINSAVKQVIEDDFSAHMVANIYEDMLVNVDAHRRGEHAVAELYSRVWKENPDPVQQIIGRAYEKLFQRQDTSIRYVQTIIRTFPPPSIEDNADKIASIILNSRRENWLRSAKEFAEILKANAPAMSRELIYVISNIQPNDFSPEGRSPIPPKGKSDVKELEKRLGGVVYGLRQLEGEKDNKPCSLPEFMKFLENSKIKISDNEALIWYYRDLIGGKVIKVPEVSVASGSLYPFSPKTWQPGDPIHELDVMLSKSVGGVIIPGVTTKKWIMKRGQHLTVGRDYPDLDLWIDSSGSMQNPSYMASHAVAAGMIVAKSFLATRKAVRVVNFSAPAENHPGYESTVGFIRDEDEIDRKLISYIGGWTNLPIAEIEKPYLAQGKQKYIVGITDLGIQDMGSNAISRLKRVFEQSVGGSIFLIGEGGGAQKVFEDIGFEVVPVKDVADLDQHALKLTKKLFEERLAI